VNKVINVFEGGGLGGPNAPLFGVLFERLCCVYWDEVGVRAATECVARSRSEETQECACRLLRALAEGNPKFQTQVYRGLTALLSSSSAKAQHMAAQSLRIVQVAINSLYALFTARAMLARSWES